MGEAGNHVAITVKETIFIEFNKSEIRLLSALTLFGILAMGVVVWQQKNTIWSAIKSRNDGLLREELQRDQRQLHFRNQLGQNPIHYIFSMGHHSGLRILLEAGDDPNRKIHEPRMNWHGWTPLHIAVNLQDTEAILILFEYGADAYAVDAKGKTPFDLAAKSPAILSLLECLMVTRN
jgi:hypothetical protein